MYKNIDGAVISYIHQVVHMLFISYDIETDGLFDEEGHPPSVLCAAAVIVASNPDVGTLEAEPVETRTWPRTPRQARCMSAEEVVEMSRDIIELCALHKARVLAWNGVNFDLRLLLVHCIETGHLAVARELRKVIEQACDPMLNFAWAKGFPVSLSSVGAALPTPVSKTGVGAECSAKWLNGTDEDRSEVLHYCVNDTLMAIGVVDHIMRTNCMQWITKRGSTCKWQAPGGARRMLAPMSDTTKHPFANNEWMEGERPTASNFIGYLADADAALRQ